MVTRYDFIEMKASVSNEGWIRDRPVITRSGIFEYRSIDGKVTREYRPDQEVFEDASLRTLNGIPITDGHNGIITASNSKGIIGTVLSPGIKQDNSIVADIIIHDANKLGKRRDLSLGYECDVDDTPGVTENGERYDAIQKNIKYNHLAVVVSGRAGNAKLRLDSTSAVNGPFSQEGEMSEPKLVTIRFDDLEYLGSPEVAKRLSKYEEEAASYRSKADALEAERDTLRASFEEEKNKTDKATKAALAAARARIKLEDIAGKSGVQFKDDSTDNDIKIDVIHKLKPGVFKFDGKSDDYIAATFDLIIADQNNKQENVAGQRKQLTEPRADSKDIPDQSPNAARQRMIARIRGEKEAA